MNRKVFFCAVIGNSIVELERIPLGSNKEAIESFIARVDSQLTEAKYTTYGWSVGLKACFPTEIFSLPFISEEHQKAMLNKLSHIANDSDKCQCTFGPCGCYFDSVTNIAVNPL